jgi:hypothetical protein
VYENISWRLCRRRHHHHHSVSTTRDIHSLLQLRGRRIVGTKMLQKRLSRFFRRKKCDNLFATTRCQLFEVHIVRCPTVAAIISIDESSHGDDAIAFILFFCRKFGCLTSPPLTPTTREGGGSPCFSPKNHKILRPLFSKKSIATEGGVPKSQNFPKKGGVGRLPNRLFFYPNLGGRGVGRLPDGPEIWFGSFPPIF